jgi:hypothetical protein
MSKEKDVLVTKRREKIIVCSPFEVTERGWARDKDKSSY